MATTWLFIAFAEAKGRPGVFLEESERRVPERRAEWQGRLKGPERNGAAMDRSFIIEARDVILRPYRLDDVDAIYNLTQESAVLEFLPDWNAPKAQRREWLADYEIPENDQFLAAAAAGGHIGDLRLRLAVTVRGTGQCIGWCCTGIKEELPPPNREVVYAVAERYRSQGYATQAVRSLVEYLFSQTDTAAINAVALPRNVASNKVIQKSGLPYVGLVDIDGEPFRRYQRIR